MKNFSIILAATLFLFSCGNSVEKQQANWDKNKATVAEYAAKYPVLAEKMNAQLAEAETAFNAAIEIADEKESIKAMKAANRLATNGAIYKVQKYESKIRDVESSINGIKHNFTSEEFTEKTSFLLEEATKELELARAVNDVTYTSADSALMAYTVATEILVKIDNSLDAHATEVYDARPDEEEEDAAEETVAEEEVQETKTTTEKKVVAEAKCKKCKSTLKKGATKCKSCGAPVKK
jgi:hypothetical protein